MTDQEKNEVLAKWRGFVFNEGERGWYYPDGAFSMSARPDFLHSLDAQAKWLWDKVRDMGHFNFVVAALVDAEYDGEHKAEACAEVILALIEEEK